MFGYLLMSDHCDWDNILSWQLHDWHWNWIDDWDNILSWQLHDWHWNWIDDSIHIGNTARRPTIIKRLFWYLIIVLSETH